MQMVDLCRRTSKFESYEQVNCDCRHIKNVGKVLRKFKAQEMNKTIYRVGAWSGFIALGSTVAFFFRSDVTAFWCPSLSMG